MEKIPFNRPVLTGSELTHVRTALESGHLSGDGPFTKKCSEWLTQHLNVKKTLITHSGTAALELATLLINLKADDEVIMPSFTFVSTANAVVLRGARPVFVDVRPDTLNLDEKKIEAAVTKKTRAIIPVHYAGVACEMDEIMSIASRHNLAVIEDNAQGIFAKYKGQHLGAIGHMNALSFHDTKNIVAGEGGALLLTREHDLLRAEILREKGTNRSSFYRGEVNKYEWMDVGSSYLPSDLNCALLWGQLEHSVQLQARRMKLWNFYNAELEMPESQEKLRRPIVPSHCEHNAHIFYILLPTTKQRDQTLSELKGRGIHTTFHYVPLHSAPAGIKYGRAEGSMVHTEDLSARLLRLPMWLDLDQGARVIHELKNILNR